MTDLRVGDEVRVFESRSRHTQQPAEGWVGKITNVARKYAKADYVVTEPSWNGGEDRHYERVIEFGITTGLERGATNSTYAAHVRTPAEVERAIRREAAMDALSRVGLQFTSSGRRDRLTLEQIEALAEVAKTFGEG